MSNKNVYGVAAVVGAVTGLRAFAGPAVVSQFARSGRLRLRDSKLSALSSSRMATALAAFGALELAGDKLPSAPSRTEPGALITRMVFGGLSGAAICLARREGVVAGALLGATAACAAAFLGKSVRLFAVENWKVPAIAAALVEDAVTYGGGIAALRSLD